MGNWRFPFAPESYRWGGRDGMESEMSECTALGGMVGMVVGSKWWLGKMRATATKGKVCDVQKAWSRVELRIRRERTLGTVVVEEDGYPDKL